MSRIRTILLFITLCVSLVLPVSAQASSLQFLNQSTVNASPASAPILQGDLASEELAPNAAADRLDLKIDAYPAIYIPGKPIQVTWKLIGGQSIQSGTDAHILVRVPKGVSPSDSSLAADIAPDRSLSVSIDNKQGVIAWNVGPDAEFPIHFSVDLWINEERIDQDAVVIDKAQFEVAKAGGKLQAMAGRVGIEIPLEASDQPLLFNVRYPSPNKLPSVSLTWEPLEVIAVGKTTQENVKSFRKPITIKVKYDEPLDFNWNEEDLMLFYYNEEALDWYPLETVVDPESNTLTAQTDHLTVFDYKAATWQTNSLPTVDAFKVSNFTGAGTYEMGFWTPPGPAGLQPDLKLTYNSQVIDESSAYSQASWVGMGWTLETGSITRNMHETNDNTADDTFAISAGGVSGVLLPVGGTLYNTADQSFIKVERLGDQAAGTDTWKVWGKDGTVYVFAHATKTKGTVGCEPTTLNLPWKWSLSLVTDKYGNTLSYTYDNEQKVCTATNGQPGLNQVAVYPKYITYGNNKYRVWFEREARTDYQTSWTQRDSRVLYGTQRLKQVHIQHNTGSWTTVRRYAFTYYPNTELTNNILPRFTWSGGGKTLSLWKVQEFDGSNNALPAVEFKYFDNQHLTWVNNSQGGQVEFTYEVTGTENEPWSYFDDVNDEARSYYSYFGSAPYECSSPYFYLSWAHVQGDIKCDAGGNGYFLQVGQSDRPVGIAERSVPEHVMKPGTKFEVAIYFRAYSYGTFCTDLNFGFYDPSLASSNQYMVRSDDYLPCVGTNFYDMTGRVYMPVNFNPTTTKLRIEADNAIVQRIQFSAWPTYYRVRARTVRDLTSSDRTATYAYSFDNASPNTAQTSEAVASVGENYGNLYTYPFREYRGNAMTEEKVTVNSKDLSTLTWYHQSDYLKGREYRQLFMERTFQDHFESATSPSPTSWTLTGGTHTRSFLPAADFDYGIKSDNSAANWNVSFARSANSLTDGKLAISHFRLSGTNAQGEIGLVSPSGKFFGVVIQPETGGTGVRLRYNTGSGTVNDQLLISGGNFAKDKWYGIMLFVDNNDGFRVRIWQLDNPSVAGEATKTGFGGETWKFRERVYSGSLWLDSYYEGMPQSETSYRFDTVVQQANLLEKVDLDVVWARLLETETRTYAGDASWYGTKVLYGYEQADQNGQQFGNLTRTTYQEWNGSTWNNHHATQVKFYPTSSSSKYLVSLPAREVTLGCAAGCDFSGNGGLLTEKLYLYDANSTYNLAPTAGVVTKVRTLLDNVGGQYRYSEVGYGYEYGSVSQITTYQGYGTASASPNAQPFTTTKDIDDVYKTYVLWEETALDHRTTFDYNYSVGLVNLVTDPNGQSEGAVYDGFGRMVAACAPLDWDGNLTNCSQGGAQATLSIYYDNYGSPTNPFNIRLSQRLDTSRIMQTVRYYNGLGELIQTQSLAIPVELHGTGGATTQNIAVDTKYDVMGRLSMQTLPYTYTGSASYQTPNFANRAKTETSYDLLSRVTSVREPDQRVTQTAYVERQVRTTDPLGKLTIANLDLWGRVDTVMPPTGPGLDYSYDVLGRLTSVTKGTGQAATTTTIQYDFGGRKTQMTDPDMGTWDYAYDALGNLVSQTDARRSGTDVNRICQYYDEDNRLIGKDYLTSGACASTNPDPATLSVSYGYGQTSVTLRDETNLALANTAGRRSSMVDASGATYWSYDERGRVVQQVREIYIGSTFVDWYEISYGYNSADLVTTLTYPDGEVITTEYDARALATKLSTSLGGYYVGTGSSSSTYDELGRMKRLPLANTLTALYTYYQPADTNQGMRLRTLQMGSLLNLVYTYDANGNVDTVQDTLGGSVQLLDFGYDDLNRLRSATASTHPSLPTYNYSYTYAPETGLLETKTEDGDQSTYLYEDSAHPHAATGLSQDAANTYDANGNMLMRTEDGITYTQTWRVDNRLKQVAWEQNGAHTTTFVYDGDGNRLLRIERFPDSRGQTCEITTVYLGGIYEEQLVTTALELTGHFTATANE